MEGGRQNYISASWHIATKAATVVVLLLSLVGSNAFDIKSTLLCFSHPPPQMAEWSEHISSIAISSLPHNNTAHFSYTAVYNDQFYHDSHISHFGLFYPSVKVVDLCGRWEKHTFLFFSWVLMPD